jgi:hypothetical protein
MRGPIHVVAVISDDDNGIIDDRSSFTSSCTTTSSTSSSTSTSSSSMMKVVQFSADVTDFHTLSRSEYSLWELQHCFYTSKEKKQQWKHQNKAVTRFEKGKPEANDQVHRGLEPLTNRGYQLLIRIKNKCVDSVMDQQEEQWRSEIVDLERLAKASQQISKASIVIAIKMAKRDAQQARKAYLQMNRLCQSHQLASASASTSTSSPNIVDVETMSVASSLTDERSTLSTGRMTGNKYNTCHRHHHHHHDDDGYRKRNPTTTTTTTTSTTPTNTTMDLMRSE